MTKDRLGAMLLLPFCLGYLILAQDILVTDIQTQAGLTARSLPNFLGILGLILSAWLLLRSKQTKPAQLRQYRWLPALSLIVMMIAYAASLRPLGFVPATALFLFGGFVLLGANNKWVAVAVAVGLALSFWWLVNVVLGVHLPPLPGTWR